MALPSQKTPANFSFAHSGQPDDYGVSVGDFSVVQENFDSRAIFNQDQINAIIAALQSVTDSDSGADNIKATPISGVGDVNTDTVQEILEVLKSQLNDATAGALPDRGIQAIKIAIATITTAELAFDPATQAELDAVIATLNTHTGDSTIHTTATEKLRFNVGTRLYMYKNIGGSL